MLDTGARSTGSYGSPTTTNESVGGTACLYGKGQKERFTLVQPHGTERCNALRDATAGPEELRSFSRRKEKLSRAPVST
jgi:hypothetical protein